MKKLLESPPKKSGLGKQVAKIVVGLLKDILLLWVSKKISRGARPL